MVTDAREEAGELVCPVPSLPAGFICDGQEVERDTMAQIGADRKLVRRPLTVSSVVLFMHGPRAALRYRETYTDT